MLGTSGSEKRRVRFGLAGWRRAGLVRRYAMGEKLITVCHVGWPRLQGDVATISRVTPGFLDYVGVRWFSLLYGSRYHGGEESTPERESERLAVE